MSTADEDKGLSADEKIINEAKRRFRRCQEWESVARVRFEDDVKFVNGDSDNMYQWPSAIQGARNFGTADERPCLTINKTQLHCNQVINDARQNKTSIKVKPVGGDASYDAAQVYEGMFRHIEYISDAQSAYSTAFRYQVWAGIGYIRLATDYADDTSFDQDIYIRRVKDPKSVYVDPDMAQADGSDMRFAFVFDDMAKDEFDLTYPAFKDDAPQTTLGSNTPDDWITKDHIRIAEYMRRKETKDLLIVDGDGKHVLRSSLPAELSGGLRLIIEDPATRTREVTRTTVEWFMIIGDKIAERGIWPSKYIPIIRVPGNETVIDGELDRKGLVRALKDPQRMLNYNASCQVEFGALQTKTPWVGAYEAVEENIGDWAQANTSNSAILTYKGRDDSGREIPAPQRTPPPDISPAYEFGASIAERQMMAVTGQMEATLGEQGNERSGRAINARQRQGETATYHFIDHQAMALRFLAKQVLDLIPRIYDTPRLIKIMAEDGTDTSVMLDPDAKAAYQKTANDNAAAAEQIVFNPNVGRYDVVADVGPDYATRRQEAADKLSMLIQSAPEVMPIIGDLAVKAMDFPYADEAAERLERMVPAQAKGDGGNPQDQAMAAQMQNLQGLVQVMGEKLKEAEAKNANKSGELEVNQYKAVTERLDKLLEHMGQAQAVEAETEMAAHQTGLNMLEAEHAAALAPEPAEAAA